jgi:hypothetical protein
MRVEFRLLTELEMQERGLAGATDQALLVAMDGRQIGYTDDYGTFTPFDRPLDHVHAPPRGCVEQAANAVGDMYAEWRGSRPADPLDAALTMIGTLEAIWTGAMDGKPPNPEELRRRIDQFKEELANA